MFTGLEAYKADAGFAKAVKNVLTPVAAELVKHNVRPEQFLNNMIQSHMRLANPQVPTSERLALASHLLKTYGLDLPTAAGAPATDASGQPGAQPSPEVLALRQQIAQLESRINGTETSVKQRNEAEAAAQLQKLQDEVTIFANDPANVYFDDVADDIALLIKGSGGKMSLKDAYERAVHANPVTRAKEMAKATAAAVEKANKEAAERAEAARRANKGRVRTSGQQGSGTAASGSMDDTMAATLANIRKRDGG